VPDSSALPSADGIAAGRPAPPAPGPVVVYSLSHQVAVSMLGAAFPVLLPALAGDGQLTGESAGLYSMVFYAGAVVATTLCQAGFGYVGIARGSLLCVLLAAASILALVPGTLPFVLLTALGIGLGYGPTTPASSLMLLPYIGGKRVNFLFSLRQTGAPLGVLLAGVIIPPLVLTVGWQPTLPILAGLVLVVALLGWRFSGRLDATLEQPARRLPQVLNMLAIGLRQRRLRRLIAISFLFSALLATVNAYVPFVASQLAGASLEQAGWAAAIAQLGAVGGRLAWGDLADRLGSYEKVLALIGLSMSAAICLFAAMQPDWPFVALAATSLVLGATAAGWGGLTIAAMARGLPKNEVGAGTSTVMIFNYLGVFAGPPVVAAGLYATGSLRIALLCLLAVSLAATLLAGLGILQSRQPPE